MTPNLLVATQTLFSPHKWFSKSQRSERSKRTTEHWDLPVPGIYEYIPGRGWYLVATDKNPHDSKKDESIPPDGPAKIGTEHVKRETIPMAPPIQVKYSKVLRQYLLAPDYQMRKKHGRVKDETGKFYEAGFFRLEKPDNAWVECWDDHGEFIPGPYKLWVIDQATGEFRHMLKGDDPAYASSRSNSFEPDLHSEDSRSTRYAGSKPTSVKEPSAPNTRPGSLRAFAPSAPTSIPGSRNISRRNSPKQSSALPSPDMPLEEAKAKLRKMAEEQSKLAITPRSGSINTEPKKSLPGTTGA
ncbi:hypothetical protein B0J11DRAFT_36184 [Dendryphion nanum]|uniref:Uncharacterized protein n=1 Tax=Dendryphion nanum TaxID=256645 RepID=A0A9P9EKJ3_9PLEO|nr:hypothetical protein B0J11DRAFT_36184 [Dendryphion nanum]